MARRRHTSRLRQRGLTLMEVLIAVTLVALLMVGVSTALGIGLRAMERGNGRLELNRRVVRTQQILEQQILHLTPSVASCILASPETPVQMPFFQGEPLAMRFVSTYSMRDGARGFPRIIELTAIPDDARRQPPGVRLIVNELPYLGPLSTGRLCAGLQPDAATGLSVPVFAPVQAMPMSFVLADRLLRVRFRYLALRPPPLGQEWLDRWVFPELPEAIAVDLQPLPGETAGVQPVSLVLPLRVDRLPGKKYAD
ncbi:MAG: prepilin-type N-terminal cleavage/methylation domain-containing protein [Bryobacterales bacterium]|nr:prepilin-type N-terminal cleavage/methylation domain-containing protein [Bryobacterales bacterium]